MGSDEVRSSGSAGGSAVRPKRVRREALGLPKRNWKVKEASNRLPYMPKMMEIWSGPTMEAILEFASKRHFFRVAEASEATGIPIGPVRDALYKLTRQGRIVRVERGVYALPDRCGGANLLTADIVSSTSSGVSKDAAYRRLLKRYHRGELVRVGHGVYQEIPAIWKQKSMLVTRVEFTENTHREKKGDKPANRVLALWLRDGNGRPFRFFADEGSFKYRYLLYAAGVEDPSQLCGKRLTVSVRPLDPLEITELSKKWKGSEQSRRAKAKRTRRIAAIWMGDRPLWWEGQMTALRFHREYHWTRIHWEIRNRMMERQPSLALYFHIHEPLEAWREAREARETLRRARQDDSPPVPDDDEDTVYDTDSVMEFSTSLSNGGVSTVDDGAWDDTWEYQGDTGNGVEEDWCDGYGYGEEYWGEGYAGDWY